MRSFFILSLVINLVYLGWELDYQTRIDFDSTGDALAIPAGTQKLVLVKELPEPPLPRQGETSDNPTADVPQTDEVVSEDGTAPLQDQTSPEPATADVKIEKEFADDLVTQLPEISAPGIPEKTESVEPMCFSYGPFPDSKQAGELMTWFEQHQVSAQQRLETERENQLFWIYLKPLGSRSSAMQTIEELKSKGIRDYRLIETGDLQNAISLGLFSTQASVNRRLNELKNKGYQPVVIPYRDAQAIYWLDVKLAGQPDVLTQMFRESPARYNSLPVKCSEIALQ